MTRAGQPPLADYGVIGDGRSVALIARGGSIDWWCVPGPASDAVFARILDMRVGGCFDIHPMGAHRVERRYLPHTPMLETTFVTDNGAHAPTLVVFKDGREADRHAGALGYTALKAFIRKHVPRGPGPRSPSARA